MQRRRRLIAALSVSSIMLVALAAAMLEPTSAALSSIGARCTEPEFPRLLSETGLYDSIPEKRFSAAMIPYEVNSSFWNDGAKKQRHLRLPEGKKARFRPELPWQFPDGTIFALTLFLENGGAKLFVETRVLRLHEGHLHFATYTWNEQQTDAVLTPQGDRIYANIGDSSQVWQIADVADCFECHNESSNQLLGAKTSQLNRDIVVDGKPKSQIRHLADLGVVDGVPDSLDDLPRQCDPMDASAPLEDRARSYLDTNCASCHRPDGNGSDTLDLRLETPMHRSGAIRLDAQFRPTSGVIVPGHAGRSTLVRRMRRVDGFRMPNLLSTVQDEVGIRLLSDWIDSRR